MGRFQDEYRTILVLTVPIFMIIKYDKYQAAWVVVSPSDSRRLKWNSMFDILQWNNYYCITRMTSEKSDKPYASFKPNQESKIKVFNNHKKYRVHSFRPVSG